MDICIGIVSYFPDNNIRDNRIKVCSDVVKRANDIFSLPIIIVAQNGKNITIDPETIDNDVYLYKFKNKLGITEARRKLREIFLESRFEYMIMIDDDSILLGDKVSGELYVNQLKMHPGMGGAYKESLLKLFAISKEIYKQIDFPQGDAENGDFFEDMYIVKACRKLFMNKEFKFPSINLYERSDSANDKNSTWYHGQFNKHEIGDRTRAMIANL